MRDVFDVLADPTRRDVLDQLRRPRGCLVGELAAALSVSQPTVSKHLRVLREMGMVDVVVESQQRRYLLRPDALSGLEAWLAPHRAFWEERLDDLGTHLDSLNDPDGGDPR
ncbi:metalloregulator ArsR/SmtB family transcription factor [Pseudonocardia nematodicida]|uniref:Metalloregulator ArsR/SmtB family transcription factor n=1 Tax=Pseudonocardia nematodicida TaxID=1206997 RepID=A0ABV1KJ55_9PSEU